MKLSASKPQTESVKDRIISIEKKNAFRRNGGDQLYFTSSVIFNRDIGQKFSNNRIRCIMV